LANRVISFLDESKNTELIRWSDDGRSFIVIDEDEFAKTLIPELFKHNNYASFVRQLNMYGFHKKVGLSDNSMKASENKRKTPSEYWNRYFRRGRPELLWLIQKPKNPPSAKRKREDGKGGAQPDSDDEGKKYAPSTDVQDQTGAEVARASNQELNTIPNSEFANLRQELVTLQRQQKLISTVIGQIKRQNDQMYQQATAFQAMHDRHESSINAILTFLATFYNRSLEGHGNANLADMFKHAMPQTNAQQGNVMEMPDVPLDMSMGNQTHGRTRRPLALLPAPDSKPQPDSPVTIASSTRPTVSPKPRNQPPPVFRPQNESAQSNTSLTSTLPNTVSTTPMIKNDAETPNLLGNTDDVMSMINAANATSPASTIDFNSALEQYQTANGKTPLTPQQRSDMLNMIANTTGVNAAGNSATAGNSSADNALTNPQPPPIPDLPEFSDLAQTDEQLNLLQRLSDEQANKVQNLADRLGPLSPSGIIPGLHNDSIPPPLPENWSLDDWINDSYELPAYDGNHDSTFNDLNSYFEAADTNATGFGTNGMSGAGADVGGASGGNEELFASEATQVGHGGVESVSSRATTPLRTVTGEDDEGTRPMRKRKRNS
jgi:heat shock transcription factor